MNRWRVRREPTFYFDPDGNNAMGPRWCVDSPAGVYWGNYETHAEALAYADQQARTRQVVLPRQPLPLTLPGSEEDSPVVVTQEPEIEYVFLTDEYDGEVVPLYRCERALHYPPDMPCAPDPYWVHRPTPNNRHETETP